MCYTNSYLNSRHEGKTNQLILEVLMIEETVKLSNPTYIYESHNHSYVYTGLDAAYESHNHSYVYTGLDAVYFSI